MKNNSWIIKIIILAFSLTIILSITSELVLRETGLIIGILVILVFIILGVIFDMIGIAVASADDRSFHAMASKTKKSSIDTAKKLVKNSPKVSSICNDVVGDICNIMSGTASVVVAEIVAIKYNVNLTLSLLIITSIVASLTIGAKAFGKQIALKNKESIIMKASTIITKFDSEIIRYLIAGGLTTIVSLASYYLSRYFLFNQDLQLHIQISNILSWIMAVTFAFFINKIFVFKNQKKELKQVINFIGSRLFSLVIDMAFMFILTTPLLINDKIAKIIVQVIVLTLNYITSKIFVFKK